MLVRSCPFHDDKDPSLYLYADGSFYCFSCSILGIFGCDIEDLKMVEHDHRDISSVLTKANKPHGDAACFCDSCVKWADRAPASDRDVVNIAKAAYCVQLAEAEGIIGEDEVEQRAMVLMGESYAALKAMGAKHGL